ncbi:hypothetical protein TYRP_004358 [Tyrophagus putrescentiae]|nr:hypothetical protein TYRP_004358 [Tyrophagus putrescentiae]
MSKVCTVCLVAGHRRPPPCAFVLDTLPLETVASVHKERALGSLRHSSKLRRRARKRLGTRLGESSICAPCILLSTVYQTTTSVRAETKGKARFGTYYWCKASLVKGGKGHLAAAEDVLCLTLWWRSHNTALSDQHCKIR